MVVESDFAYGFYLVFVFNNYLFNLLNIIRWDISDTFNGMMMFPNLIAVVALCPLVVRITKNYIDRNIKNKDVKPILSYDETIQKEMEEGLNSEE